MRMMTMTKFKDGEYLVHIMNTEYEALLSENKMLRNSLARILSMFKDMQEAKRISDLTRPANQRMERISDWRKNFAVYVAKRTNLHRLLYRTLINLGVEVELEEINGENQVHQES